MGTASTRSKAADEGDKGILLRAYAVPAAGNGARAQLGVPVYPQCCIPPPALYSISPHPVRRACRQRGQKKYVFLQCLYGQTKEKNEKKKKRQSRFVIFLPRMGSPHFTRRKTDEEELVLRLRLFGPAIALWYGFIRVVTSELKVQHHVPAPSCSVL